MTSRIVRFLIAIAELGLMSVFLTLIQIASPLSAVIAALAFCILGLIAIITGRGLPRLRGRIKGVCIFVVALSFAVIAAQAHVDQREARWVELRQTDPDTYLAELAPIDQDRWLKEPRELQPEHYSEEIKRREAELQAQREAEAVEAAEAARRAEVEATEQREADARAAVATQRLVARRAEVEATEQRKADARAEVAAQRLVAGSDDLDEHHAVFVRVAKELVASRTCTEAEFLNNGVG